MNKWFLPLLLLCATPLSAAIPVGEGPVDEPSVLLNDCNFNKTVPVGGVINIELPTTISDEDQANLKADYWGIPITISDCDETKFMRIPITPRGKPGEDQVNVSSWDKPLTFEVKPSTGKSLKDELLYYKEAPFDFIMGFTKDELVVKGDIPYTKTLKRDDQYAGYHDTTLSGRTYSTIWNSPKNYAIHNGVVLGQCDPSITQCLVIKHGLNWFTIYYGVPIHAFKRGDIVNTGQLITDIPVDKDKKAHARMITVVNGFVVDSEDL